MDHIPCIKAWAESLGGINYPLLSDFWPHGEVADMYGVFREDGKSERAIFVIDKEGIIRYIDIHDIDSQPSNDVLRQILRKIDPDAAKNEPKKDQPKVADLPQGGIVMYCTPWCADCKKAQSWLRKNQIKFSEVDITRTPGAAERVMSWADGNRTTPTFDVDGTVVVDWDVDALEKALRQKGYF